MRPRQVDMSKPMPVVQSQRELELNEDGALVPKKDMQDSGIENDDNEDEVSEASRIVLFALCRYPRMRIESCAA
jgi:hypothetical protein